MNSQPAPDSLPALRSQGPAGILPLRVIYFALGSGVAMFLAVSIVLTVERSSPAFQGGAPAPQAADVASWILMLTPLLGVLLLTAGYLAGKAALVGARRDWSGPHSVAERERRLFTRFAILAVVRGAMLEVFGIFGLSALLLGAHWGGLAAPLIAMAILLMMLPSQARYEAFLSQAVG